MRLVVIIVTSVCPQVWKPGEVRTFLAQTPKLLPPSPPSAGRLISGRNQLPALFFRNQIRAGCVLPKIQNTLEYCIEQN